MNRLDIINKEFTQGGVFVQIGTNAANDFFTEMCRKYKPSKIILVEPNSGLNHFIEKCYEGYNYNIENVVISDINGKIKLYNNPHTNQNVHFSIKPMKDWWDLSKFIECESLTFKALIEKYNIDKIEFLNIDTEGNDSVILDSINFDEVNIKSILYEYWGFTNNHYTYESHLHGKDGMEHIKNKLTTLGYDVTNVYEYNTLTDQFAFKK